MYTLYTINNISQRTLYVSCDTSLGYDFTYPNVQTSTLHSKAGQNVKKYISIFYARSQSGGPRQVDISHYLYHLVEPKRDALVVNKSYNIVVQCIVLVSLYIYMYFHVLYAALFV